jgi:hypothetical protein
VTFIVTGFIVTFIVTGFIVTDRHNKPCHNQSYGTFIVTYRTTDSDVS